MYKVIDWCIKPPFESEQKMKDLLTEMDRNGVFYGVVALTAEENKQLDKLADKYGERFKFMAYIDPYAADPLSDIDNYVVKGQADLIWVNPAQLPDGKAISPIDEKMLPIYEKCEKENIAVYIVSGGEDFRDEGFNDPIYVDHVARLYPKMPLIVGHGNWPCGNECGYLIYLRNNIYIAPDRYMLDPALEDQPEYILLANNRIDRFIFGSGYPEIGITEAIDKIKNSGVGSDALKFCLYNNAARLLKL